MANKLEKFEKKANTMGSATQEFLGLTNKDDAPEQKTKRAINMPEKKFKKGELRTKSVSVRVSESTYNKLIDNVNNSSYRSMADYLNALIEKGM